MITLKLVRHKIKYDNIRICNKNKNTYFKYIKGTKSLECVPLYLDFI